MSELTFAARGLDPEVTQKLSSHFHGRRDAHERWDDLWTTGTFLPWDNGCPNPALQEVLECHRHALGGSMLVTDTKSGVQRRKRALVPGCGRGYDVLLLASFGYDAYGLDVSEKAVILCREYAQANQDRFPPRDANVGSGKVRFLQGDFFMDEWRRSMDGDGMFEILFDYTFFCAVHPSLRSWWSLQYWQLLSVHPESRLICAEFPTKKDPTSGGPPYGVSSKLYLAHLTHPGLNIVADEIGELAADQSKESHCGFDRIFHGKPSQNNALETVVDWISIWARSSLS